MRMGLFAGLIAMALFSIGAGAQQFHGIASSVNSVSPNSGMISPAGIPASVTSQTSVHRNGHGNSGTMSFVPVPPLVHEHHDHDDIIPVFIPVYYPYYSYFPYYGTENYDQPNAQPDIQQQQPQSEPSAPTIFENRIGYKAPPIIYNNSASGLQPSNASKPAAGNSLSAAAAAQPTADSNSASSSTDSSTASDLSDTASNQPTTILIFHDGHILEIGNYAIVGDVLYNLYGDYRSRRIQLADLNLDATVQANSDRGHDFRLPKR